jgi:hypothetical protein
MAITFEELKAIADGTDLKKFCDPEKQVLLFLGLGRDGVCHLIVRLEMDGEGIHFHVPYLSIVPTDHPYLNKALMTLMEANNRMWIGRFCYDPDDGEVYLDWFIPLEDNTLTSQQLECCLTVLMFSRRRHEGAIQAFIGRQARTCPLKKEGSKGIARRLLSKGGLSEAEEARLRRLFQDLRLRGERPHMDEDGPSGVNDFPTKDGRNRNLSPSENSEINGRAKGEGWGKKAGKTAKKRQQEGK